MSNRAQQQPTKVSRRLAEALARVLLAQRAEQTATSNNGLAENAMLAEDVLRKQAPVTSAVTGQLRAALPSQELSLQNRILGPLPLLASGGGSSRLPVPPADPSMFLWPRSLVESPVQFVAPSFYEQHLAPATIVPPNKFRKLPPLDDARRFNKIPFEERWPDWGDPSSE
jgi:hypothetical protein